MKLWQWIDFWKGSDEIVASRYTAIRNMGSGVRESEFLDVEEI